MSFAADVSRFSAKAKANIEQVVLGSIEDLFELATRRQASSTETGTYIEGFVPVDTGYLIGSSRIAINGALVAEGKVAGANSTPPDAAVALMKMELGDTASLMFTAKYAPHVEYGTNKMAGRFFMRNAVLQWQAIVDANAEYIGGP